MVETPAGQLRIHAHAAPAAGEALRPYDYVPAELGAHEVEIAVTHCGICHSDLHLIDNDWGVSAYPLVPGHEIVGTVVHAGSEAAGLDIGQRIGVGWLAGSCMVCEQCRGANENLCRQARPTCVGRHGGYATHVRVDARFAAPLPDALLSEYGAPLLCAGITVFAPLSRRGLKPGARVGVVGLGGLGHLAVQYASAMGSAVTVFSSTADKQDEARRFGADQFVNVSRRGALAGEANTCDLIVATVPADLPWADYVSALKPNGLLCIVGVSPGEVRMPALGLIEGQKTIGGSAIGSNAEIRAMFQFSVEHAIMPVIELYAMKDVNKALERLRQNQVRYRAVLVN
ncbi:MAG: NAD(P)-dependent alcohol dehydrogenase [Candidatus Binatia bacterium]